MGEIAPERSLFLLGWALRPLAVNDHPGVQHPNSPRNIGSKVGKIRRFCVARSLDNMAGFKEQDEEGQLKGALPILNLCPPGAVNARSRGSQPNGIPV